MRTIIDSLGIELRNQWLHAIAGIRFLPLTLLSFRSSYCFPFLITCFSDFCFKICIHFTSFLRYLLLWIFFSQISSHPIFNVKFLSNKFNKWFYSIARVNSPSWLCYPSNPLYCFSFFIMYFSYFCFQICIQCTFLVVFVNFFFSHFITFSHQCQILE